MGKQTKNILIVTPSFKIIGGVANHFMGLSHYWKNHIYYSFIGKRPHLHAIFTIFPDFIAFIYKLIFHKIDIVIVNPSLRRYQLNRDSLFVLIAQLFRKKVVTMIHGWDFSVANKLKNNPKWFRRTFGKSAFIYVLCRQFQLALQEISPKTPVLLTTTKVSDELLDGFDINSRTGHVQQILFLARIEKTKGIDIAIATFQLLQTKYPHLRLSVCGSGTALKDAISTVAKNNINGIDFHGNISGEALKTQFRESQLYILPTYEEGMATSVLEAMAFGLPIISRPVGGIVDFFQMGEMGELTHSFNPIDYAKIIERYISNPELTRHTAFINHKYAIENFLASQVTKKFEFDISKYIN